MRNRDLHPPLCYHEASPSDRYEASSEKQSRRSLTKKPWNPSLPKFTRQVPRPHVIHPASNKILSQHHHAKPPPALNPHPQPARAYSAHKRHITMPPRPSTPILAPTKSLATPRTTLTLTLTPLTQTRHATLIRRPHRPYTFTQLLTLSDGSTSLHRTTSPHPIYRSVRDTRNTPMWNPSNAKMAAVEEDEAGRLRAFRRRFGRGWDASSSSPSGSGVTSSLGVEAPGTVKTAEEAVPLPGDRVAERGGKEGVRRVEGEVEGPASAQGEVGRGEEAKGAWGPGEDNLMDLISEFGRGGERKGKFSVLIPDEVRVADDTFRDSARGEAGGEGQW